MVKLILNCTIILCFPLSTMNSIRTNASWIQIMEKSTHRQLFLEWQTISWRNEAQFFQASCLANHFSCGMESCKYHYSHKSIFFCLGVLFNVQHCSKRLKNVWLVIKRKLILVTALPPFKISRNLLGTQVSSVIFLEVRAWDRFVDTFGVSCN